MKLTDFVRLVGLVCWNPVYSISRSLVTLQISDCCTCTICILNEVLAYVLFALLGIISYHRLPDDDRETVI